MGQKPKKGTTAPWVLKLATQFYMFKSLFDKEEPLLTPEKTAMITRDMICDDSKARRELNFNSIGLEEMIKQTHDWLALEGIV